MLPSWLARPCTSQFSIVVSKSKSLRDSVQLTFDLIDDSGSMKKTDSMPDGKGGIIAQDRMTRQADLVTRMGDLMTRAAPEGTVHLRFINSPDTSGNNLTEDQLEARMKFTPDGSTRLGTNLKAKVLDEFVHQPLNANTELKRPLLIMVVTDGCPNEEGDQDFHDAIVDSLKFVKDRGYGQESKLWSGYFESHCLTIQCSSSLLSQPGW